MHHGKRNHHQSKLEPPISTAFGIPYTHRRQQRRLHELCLGMGKWGRRVVAGGRFSTTIFLAGELTILFSVS
jgi:hypothetical protein